MTKEQATAELEEIKKALRELKAAVNAMQSGTPTPSNLNELVTITDLAKMGGPHPQTLRRMIQNGEIPGVRIGRKYFIRKSELEKLLTPKH
ncbi:MAG: helix-turn-helix domain-containing protein [Haliscomenobacter sp.]|nr:helix-turn-helix domain-containing protein [Haliscomenobacter sp.]